MREKEGKRYMFVLNFRAHDVEFTLRKKARSMYTGEGAEEQQKLSAFGTAVFEVIDNF
ncbi:Beta-galactosidase C-terminal domain [Lachnospiraceae bacterium 48-42]